MKPIWANGTLTVELHVPDVRALEKARQIAEALTAMHQPGGEALVAVIDYVLGTDSAESGRVYVSAPDLLEACTTVLESSGDQLGRQDAGILRAAIQAACGEGGDDDAKTA